MGKNSKVKIFMTKILLISNLLIWESYSLSPSVFGDEKKASGDSISEYAESNLMAIDLISGKLIQKSPLIETLNMENSSNGLRIPSIYICKLEIGDNVYVKNSTSNSYEIINNFGKNDFFDLFENYDSNGNSIILQKIAYICEISNKAKIKPEVVQEFQNAARKNDFYFWKRTFKKHGSHIIKKFYIGGQIQINFLDPLLNLTGINSLEKLNEISKLNTNHTLAYKGGSELFWAKKFTNSYLNSDFKNWTQSIYSFPIHLYSAKNLHLYSQYFQNIDSKLVNLTQEAFTRVYFEENGDVLQISRKLQDEKDRLENLKIEVKDMKRVKDELVNETSFFLTQNTICIRTLEQLNTTFSNLTKVLEENLQKENEKNDCVGKKFQMSSELQATKTQFDTKYTSYQDWIKSIKEVNASRDEIYSKYTSCNKNVDQIYKSEISIQNSVGRGEVIEVKCSYIDTYFTKDLVFNTRVVFAFKEKRNEKVSCTIKWGRKSMAWGVNLWELGYRNNRNNIIYFSVWGYGSKSGLYNGDETHSPNYKKLASWEYN